MATAKEQMNKLLDSFRQFWSRQEKKNKIIYISLLAAAVIIAIVAAVLLNRKDYVVLYENLDVTEAAEIAAIIEDAGYEYTIKGGTITVPEGTQDKLTMTLAQQGYPKSKLTYDMYTSNVGMFTTESEKNYYAKMALQDRLSAIIASLEPVDRATVTLDIPQPKNTVIAAYQADPTASVTVYLRENTVLTNEQIRGITHIVKMSVAGLEEDHVFITDQHGVPLIADENDIDVILEETRQLRFKTDLENQIKAKIVELLTPAYNDDGFSVAVNMVLNFDAKVYEDTVYTPSTEDERGMLQHAQAENATGYATAEGGIVGVERNADDTYPTGDTNGIGEWSENSVDNTYLVNTYKEQVEKAGYTIDSLSIATLIYTDYLPDATKVDLAQLIGNAASVNPERINEVVTVTSLPKYTDPEAEEEEQKYLFGLTLRQLLILGGILLGLLLILVIVLVAVSKSAKKKRKAFEQELLAANTGGANEPLIDRFAELSEHTPGGVDIPSLLGSDENSKEVMIRREISEFARQRPEIVAQLLRTWMNEEDELTAAGKSKTGKKEKDDDE